MFFLSGEKPVLPFINKFIFVIFAFMAWFKIVSRAILFYICTERRSPKHRGHLDVVLHMINGYFGNN